MSAGAPHTLLTDLGQVMIGWEPYGAVADVLDPEAWAAFVREADFARLNHALDTGRPVADVAAGVGRADHAVVLRHYVEHFAASLTGPVPGTAAVLDELAAAGVRLLGLSNWSAETFHHAAVAASAVARLEDVLVSGEVGLAKPDRRIFELAVKRFALEPARTVFVDDSPANVAAAREVGLLAVHFTGADRLRADLRGLGMPPAT